MEACMRHERLLGEHVWYLVGTAVNVGEPLFQLRWTEKLLCRVLRDAKGIFSFEMCGLAFEGATLSFYIKPADGKELPKIMQWIKQTFSARFNVIVGRTGHVWGERYRLEILGGEPPKEAVEVDWEMVEEKAKTEIPADVTYALSWDSPRDEEIRLKMSTSRKKPPQSAAPPV
jgi:hypothetical protein